MNKLIVLTKNDFKNIIRDDILKYFFLAVPLLFIIIFILVIPVVIHEFPVVSNYTHIILSFFALELPMIIGFVISFMMLDEKDERVFTALRVMPVSLFQFLFYRLSFAVFFTFVFVFIMLYFNGLYHIPVGVIFLNSLSFAMIAPIVILLEVTFANNKVTGFAIFKGLNFIFIIPVASFFIKSKWGALSGLIPSYWPLNSLVAYIDNQTFSTESVISMVYSGFLIVFLSLLFKRKVFYLK